MNEITQYTRSENFKYLVIEAAHGDYYGFNTLVKKEREIAMKIVSEDDDFMVIGWKVSKTLPVWVNNANSWIAFYNEEDVDYMEEENVEDSYKGVKVGRGKDDEVDDENIPRNVEALEHNNYDDEKEEKEDDEEEEEEEELFVPEIDSPTCEMAEQETIESEDDDAEEESLDTEFTRDYYRLVKFESNRSLANSEKYDHCPQQGETASSVDSSTGLLPPPDRQVALQTVLDFIAEQQRYCAIRETADAVAPNELPHGLDPSVSSSTLLQLRHLIADDDDTEAEDSSDDEGATNGRDGAVLHSGFSTNWMPVHGSRAELVDLNNAEVRLEYFFVCFHNFS